MPEDKVFQYDQILKLESGGILPSFQLQYTTRGKINAAGTNVVWVCHALTGSAEFTSWWPGLFGENELFDPREYFIICANTLGGCYGSTGPLSVNPITKKPYHHLFPFITNRDIVYAFNLLRQHLGIHQVHTLIGGSLGGQQALEWAIMQPNIFQHLIQIASNAKHSPWGIAFNESQRQAIVQDLTWQLNIDTAGLAGMKVARSIALLSYRNYQTYQCTQSDQSEGQLDGFRASAYQVYQGEKLAKRFNAFTYWTLSKVMDAHHVGRGRGGMDAALKTIRAKALFVGITSDVLFPLQEQEYLADRVPGSSFEKIDSIYGHDGFLVEVTKLTHIIRDFFKKGPPEEAVAWKTK